MFCGKEDIVMKAEFRNGSVILDGYVNVVERISKPIPDKKGVFVERIRAGAFQRALDKVNSLPILLDHDQGRKIASTGDGSATLYEDNIGLRAIVKTSDNEVMRKAREGKLRGWSFGFYANKQEYSTTREGMRLRTVKDLDLIEVSLIDERRSPVYIATSVEARGNSEKIVEYRDGLLDKCTGNSLSDYYSVYETRIKNLKK